MSENVLYIQQQIVRGKRKLIISVREDVIRRSLLPQLKASPKLQEKNMVTQKDVISLVKARKSVQKLD